MKIGIAGPMSLTLLELDLPQGRQLPIGYDFPPISDLINAYIRRGHEVVGYTTSTDIVEPQVFHGPRLTICIAPRAPHAARDLFRSERAGLVKLMKRYPAEILHAQWSYEFAWAALSTGIPTLVTVHDHAWTVLKHHRHPYRFMRLIMNQLVLQRAPHLSANSKYLYLRLAARVRERTKIVPNFFAEPLLQQSRLGSERQPYIVSVCNGFGSLKNVPNALRGFSIIRTEFPGIRYHLVGVDMEPGGSADKYAQAHNLAEGVLFRGKLSHTEVARSVADARAMLHPSREESFGVSVLESMVLGTPVVAGRSSGNIPHLLDQGNAGILVDVNDPHDIANGLREILTDNSLGSRIAERAFETAMKYYTEDAVVGSYIGYYTQILRDCPVE